MTSVSCGDWHLSWGLGSRNKLGKLSTEDLKTFTWKGYSQSRHGIKSNKGAYFIFTVDGDNLVEVDRKGGIPILTEIKDALTRLKWQVEEDEDRKVARLKRDNKAAVKKQTLSRVTQLELF